MARPPLIRADRSHDYRYLIRRWRAALRSTPLVFRKFGEASGYPLHYAETRRPIAGRPWLYFSAGIHGDESAATEGLVTWMERHGSKDLDRYNFLIFPCLNPWGLVNNCRLDAESRDLNRTYHDETTPQTAAHKAVFRGRRFLFAVAHHEDYDAPGAYVYEIQHRGRPWGEELLDAASRHVPVDNRKSIEGSRARTGLIRRRIQLDTMSEHPEAFTLHFENADRTFTLETPSEYAIDARVNAHVACIRRLIKLAGSTDRK
ncbi:MAG: M14 family metallocarboxypeptidase [Chthoniobacterales bacterium]